MSRALATHVNESDVVFGVGASFSPGYSIRWPTKGKVFIHNTVDERDLNKIIPTKHPVLGDAKLTLAMLHQALSERLRGKPRGLTRDVAARIESQNGPWLKQWMPFLTSNAKPLSPYRVIYDLLQTVDVANTIITHDAGSPRDEMIPFWKSVTPLSYFGWGKTTQLGYGLGLTMGAKIAHPEKLCINFWGEAAIGMTGMDFETCVRCQIPIMSILSNNSGMKTEYAAMKLSHEKYRTCDISGNYADFAKAMGGYGERVTEPEQVVHAIVNGIRATKEGKPVLLEFITTQDGCTSRRGGAMPAARESAWRTDEPGLPHVPLEETSRPADLSARHGCDHRAASARRHDSRAHGAGCLRRQTDAAHGVRLLSARRDHERVDAGRRQAALSSSAGSSSRWRRSKSRLTIVSGLENRHAYGPVHAITPGTWLSGASPGASADSTSGDTTADQIAAQHIGRDTLLPSIEVATEAPKKIAAGAWEGTYSDSLGSTISFRDRLTPLPMEFSPRSSSIRCSLGARRPTSEPCAPSAERASSISLRTATADLQKRLGRSDRGALRDYLDTVRDVEHRVERAETRLLPSARVAARGCDFVR